MRYDSIMSRKHIGLWVFLIIAIVATVADAQERRQSPLSCIADAQNLIIRDRYGHSTEINQEQWDAMVEVEGPLIWGGYEGDNPGWPDNIHRLWNVYGDIGEQEIRLWIWTDDDGYYYLFAFIWEKTDSRGYFGYHPCGHARVDASEWEWLANELAVEQ